MEHRKVDPVSLKTIMSAKTRPPGVSKLRWKMELSRRRFKGYPDAENAHPRKCRARAFIESDD